MKLNEESCYKKYSSSDKGLTFEDFKKFITESAIFTSKVPINKLKQVFLKFDHDQDSYLNKNEFNSVWEKWIEIILKPECALIIIDVQNDFISGSLSISNGPAGHKGEEVIPVVNKLLETVKFKKVLYSHDWHPRNHISFIDNSKLRRIINQDHDPNTFDKVIFSCGTEQILWPAHCIQGTEGSQLHPNLLVKTGSIHVWKGLQSGCDSYSAFRDNNKMTESVVADSPDEIDCKSLPSLNKVLREHGITDLFVCGIAFDYCVGFTCLDSLDYGYRTVLINDATRGICDKVITEKINAIEHANGLIVNSDKVGLLIDGEMRPFTLAYSMISNDNNNI